MDGAKVRVEEGESVKLSDIENVEYAVADVRSAAELVKQIPELQLVVLIDPDCWACVPDFGNDRHSDNAALRAQRNRF